ncbi:hypothetical protein ABB37_04537 [Leptomonas pyrrhocoris]|uniref:Uncharacterized protein n=1 Tax=Leptomonas pyrrhocoris TaxID=157538 RepID=A0A0M9G2P9_LEPPY|nr:hypothetical protein ABB37_04537 [Leptomonas pyrrhocoris]KPA81200.1 hypothetical protein ABB37_04537 [Leptomonas pyrrhocoris]|eukprot:XP_015659639.1 hypothetical protein ABB37_04537 [Leptomonas pyrrhocoris]
MASSIDIVFLIVLRMNSIFSLAIRLYPCVLFHLIRCLREYTYIYERRRFFSKRKAYIYWEREAIGFLLILYSLQKFECEAREHLDSRKECYSFLFFLTITSLLVLSQAGVFPFSLSVCVCVCIVSLCW